MFNYTTTKNDADLHVFFNGDLDIEGTELIDEELIPFLLNLKIVSISFKGVPFVDSSGMGLFMKLIHTLKENDVIVTVSEIRPEVYKVFELLEIPEIVGEKVFV
ncbi:STAS domain-containing protein [Virgibacillus flavescens]|uniref:STAS domain-containing protein n=1 Tax=Virgibacillus flavescens TaxID=1611422 RepID=UPI003D33B173